MATGAFDPADSGVFSLTAGEVVLDARKGAGNDADGYPPAMTHPAPSS
jgi:hypothetical protein